MSQFKIKKRISKEPLSPEALQERLLTATINDIYTPQLLLANENPAYYRALVTSYVKEWNPVGQTERDLLADMVKARFRLRRGWGHYSGLINAEMYIGKDAAREGWEPVTAEIRQAESICTLQQARPALFNIVRASETSLRRIYSRAMQQLFELQTLRLGHAPVFSPQPPDADLFPEEFEPDTPDPENASEKTQGPKRYGQQTADNPEVFTESVQYYHRGPYPWPSRFPDKSTNWLSEDQLYPKKAA